MNTKQQQEALEYFQKSAQEWAEKGKGNFKDEVNVIKERNDFVLHVISQREKTDIALDVGCGTGDLACEIALRGVNAIGVDFAQDMIDIAQEKARAKNIEKATFETRSIFDCHYEHGTFDVISANGFIEYISYQQFYEFLHFCWQALKPGGSLVLGSRNRLFNIFSLNTFTQTEIEQGVILALLNEAIYIVKNPNVLLLKGFVAAPLQEEGSIHGHTGIEVSTRYQFTPAQLVKIIGENGFEPIELSPINIHGLSPAFAKDHQAAHVSVSNFLQNFTDDGTRLIPQSSSFMIHCKKIS